MSVQWVIPHQARYIQTVNMFVGTFNVPTLNVYDFGVAANVGVVVLNLQPNTVYLIERMTVSADISVLDYTSAIDLTSPVTIPHITLQRLLDRVSVYESTIPLPGFVDQQESAVWVHSDGQDDALTATLAGILNQPLPLVGVAAVRIAVSFSVYAIESTIYNRAFRGSQQFGIGDRVRGA